MLKPKKYDCLISLAGWESECNCSDFLASIFTIPGIDMAFAANVSSTTGKDLVERSLVNAADQLVLDMQQAIGVSMKAYADEFSVPTKFVENADADQETTLKGSDCLFISYIEVKATECVSINVTIADMDDSLTLAGYTNHKIMVNRFTNFNELTITYETNLDHVPMTPSYGSCGCLEHDCLECSCHYEKDCYVTQTPSNIVIHGGIKCNFGDYLCGCPELMSKLMKERAALYILWEALVSGRCNPAAEDVEKIQIGIENLQAQHNNNITTISDSIRRTLKDDCCIECGGLKYVENVPQYSGKIQGAKAYKKKRH